MEIKAGLIDRSHIFMHPSKTLFEAMQLLCKNGQHEVCLVERSSGGDRVLAVVSRYNLVRFIAYHYLLDRALVKSVTGHVDEVLAQPIGQLGLGTVEGFTCIQYATPLLEALKLFRERKISCLPIVAPTTHGDAAPEERSTAPAAGTVVDIFEKNDMLYAVHDGNVPNLQAPVSDIIAKRIQTLEGTYLCSPSTTLRELLTIVKRTKVFRFLVVDSGKQLQGIISLRDILGFMQTIVLRDEAEGGIQTE